MSDTVIEAPRQSSPNTPTSAVLAKLGLDQDWDVAWEWGIKHRISNELSHLINTTLLWTNPNSFGTVLKVIANDDNRSLLEEWAKTEKAALCLKLLSDAAVHDASIHKKYEPLPEHERARTQFQGDLKKQFLAASLLEPPSTNDRSIIRWINTLKLWLTCHAVESAFNGNIQNPYLEQACSELRLACADWGLDQGKRIQPFLDLTTAARGFGEINRHFIYRTQLSTEKLDTYDNPDRTKKLFRRLRDIAQGKPPPPNTKQPQPLLPFDVTHLDFGKHSTLPEPAINDLSESGLDDTGLENFYVQGIDPDDDDSGIAYAEVDEEDSLLQQKQKISKILLYADEDLQFLPWSWDRLNPVENAELAQWVNDNLRSQSGKLQFVGALAWLAINTSSSLNRVLNMPIGGAISNAWSLDRGLKKASRLIPRRIPGWSPKTSEESRWVLPPAKLHTIALPTEVASILKKRRASASHCERVGGLWSMQYGDSPLGTFRATLKERLSRVTPSMLSKVLPQQIFQSYGNSAFTRLITSHPESSLPGACAYTSWTFNQVSDAINRPPLTLPLSIEGEEESIALGSMLYPDEEQLRETISKATKILNRRQKEQDLVAFHNSYVAYLTVALLAATGARPIRDPFESIAHFDFREHLVYVNDKESGPIRSGRLIPIPESLSRHIFTTYLKHLEFLSVVLNEANPAMASDLHGMAQGRPCKSTPFLFLLSRDSPSWESVSESGIEKLRLFAWPLPLNLFRHRLYDKLVDYGADHEVSESVLGHAESGALTHGDHSFRCWLEDMAGIRPHLETAFDSLGFELDPPWSLKGTAPNPYHFAKKEIRSPSIFGERERRRERKKSVKSARQDSEWIIKGFLGEKQLHELTPDEVRNLSRALLFREDGMPHPLGYLKYRHFLWRCRKHWNVTGKRVRQNRAFLQRREERSPFTDDAIGALATFDALKSTVTAIASPERGNYISISDAACIASVLVCIENRVSSNDVLSNLGKGENYRIVTLGQRAFLEYSRSPSTPGADAPVQRYAISGRAALYLNRALSGERRQPRKTVPNALRDLADILRDAGRLNNPNDFEELTKALGILVDQVNVMTLPGILAGYLSGRVMSYSPSLEDWVRLRVDHAILMTKEEGSHPVEEKSDQSSAPVLPYPKIEGNGNAPLDVARRTLATIKRLLYLYSSKDGERFFRELSKRGFRSETPAPTRKPESKDLERAISWVIDEANGKTGAAIILLARWTLHLLRDENKNRHLKGSSVRRYLNDLANPFQEIGYDANLLEMDGDELTVFYGDVLESSSAMDTGRVLAQIFQFHRWLKRNYALTDEPDWGDLPDTTSLEHVLPGIISESEYQSALQRLFTSPVHTAHEATAASFLLLCCYRFGLRSSEALGLLRGDWIQYPGMTIVVVKNNRIRTLKTVTSRRQVPLLFSLANLEQEIITRWFDQVDAAQGKGRDAPIFPGQVQDPLAKNQLKKMVITALKEVTGNPRINLHHARHTTANRLALEMIRGNISSWNRIGSNTSDPIEGHVPSLLLATNKATRRANWAIARYLGHVWSATTFKNYLHFLGDWVDEVLGNNHHVINGHLEHAFAVDRYLRPPPDITPVPQKPFDAPTPDGILKLMRLASLGTPIGQAGLSLNLDPSNIQIIEKTLYGLVKKIRLRKKEGTRDAQEEKFGFLARISASGWQRLLELATASGKDFRKNASGLEGRGDVGEVTELFGAGRQILMWRESHFALMRHFLNIFGLADQQFDLACTRQCDDELLSWAKKYRFQLPTDDVSGTQIDIAHEDNGRFRVIKRCALIWKENNQGAVRNRLELIALFFSYLMLLFND
jgi:site-specific recombinase XerD